MGGSPGGGPTRRELLRDAGAVSLAVWAGGMLGDAEIAVAVEPGGRAFLTDEELRQLRAVVDVFIPADEDGGAVEGGCAEAIDALLGAFSFSPPRIYAGGPFSDRAGHSANDFLRFVALDRYEERAWRLRIEGSRGDASLEFNGPVKGWQDTYREGLAALAEEGFADRPGFERERMLGQSSDPRVRALAEVAWPHTWQLMYAAPEYGANRELLGWRYTEWQGDRQPRGWTPEEVESGPVPGEAILFERLPLPMDDLLTLAAFGGSSELVHNLLAGGQAGFDALRARALPVVRAVKERRDGR